MAYVSNNLEDEDKKSQSQGMVAPGGASNTIQITPGAGIGNTGGTPTTGSAPQAGGQFASLDKYVNANQGQAQGLSDKIVGGINNQFNTLQGQNASTLQGVQGNVDKGYTKLNQSILDQEAADPVSFASNPGNIASFQGQANNKYTGPQSAENDASYQSQLANVNNAISTGKNSTQTESGRQGLLKGIENKPTAGVTALNSAILSKNPNSQAQIESAYNPFQSLVSGLSTGAQGINTAIGQAQNDVSTSTARANKQIADQTNALTSGLNDTLTKATEGVNSYNAGVPNYLNNAQNLNQLVEEWNNWQTSVPNFGVSTVDITNPFAGASPLKQVNAPTMNQVATKDQLELQKALNSIGNQNVNLIDPNTSVGGFTAPTGSTDITSQAQDLKNTLAGAFGQSNQDLYNQLSTVQSHGREAYPQLSGALSTEYQKLMDQINKYLPTPAQDKSSGPVIKKAN